jgi:hypothetical protein
MFPAMVKHACKRVQHAYFSPENRTQQSRPSGDAILPAPWRLESAAARYVGESLLIDSQTSTCIKTLDLQRLTMPQVNLCPHSVREHRHEYPLESRRNE